MWRTLQNRDNHGGLEFAIRLNDPTQTRVSDNSMKAHQLIDSLKSDELTDAMFNATKFLTTNFSSLSNAIVLVSFFFLIKGLNRWMTE